MRKSYLFVNAAIIAAFLMSGCQNQMAGTEQASSAEASVSETAEENTSSAGTLSGNTVIGSNFISKSSTLNEIPLGSLGKIELADYDSLEVTLQPVDTEVRDSDITSYINSQLAAELKEVSGRGAAKGDTVTVDFSGKVDGKDFDGNTGTDYPIVLGSGQMLSDFEEALYGVEAGKTVTAEVKFPDDYTAEAVAGKTAKFEITVKQIQEPSVLDDAFIAAHTKTGATTEEEYRDEIREKIQGMYQSQIELTAVSQALDELAGKSVLEPSAAFNDWLYQYYKGSLDEMLESSGTTMEEYQSSTGLDDTGMENTIWNNVNQNAPQLMLMRRIAADQKLDDAENLKSSLITYLSEVYGEDVSQEDLEAVYGSETSQLELQAAVYEYMKDHVHIIWQETESNPQ